MNKTLFCELPPISWTREMGGSSKHTQVG